MNDINNTTAPARKGRPVSVTITPICSVGRRLKGANDNLWVGYEASNPSKAYIFTESATRDNVRTAFNRIAKVNNITETRAMRLGNYAAKFNA